MAMREVKKISLNGFEYLNEGRPEGTYSMAMEQVKKISLKALVDKENSRVVFAESDEDFTDVLFSFLTFPMGTIIRLICNHNQPPTVGIGCMNNLYESVKNLDMQHFRTETCKIILLYPRNAAASQCERLKLQIDDSEPLRYFLCNNLDCIFSRYKLLSLYPHAICECGGRMDLEKQLSENNKPLVVSDAQDRWVFVKGLTRYIISDELQVKPSSMEASFPVFSKLGLMDGSTIEECNFDIGVDKVLTLLKYSLVSKTPLTETLLKHNSVLEWCKEDFDQGIYAESRKEEPESNGNEKICVKLIVSKSKKQVYYAEAGEDFVNLLCSFLTVPLGYILKEMHSSISKGSINHLYKSVQELDAEKYLKSNEHKEMLLSPKLAPDFGYENHPLDVKEDLHPQYCFSDYNYGYSGYYSTLTSDGNIRSGAYRRSTILTVKDPKARFQETTRGEGFLTGPTMFTVTDNLIITLISQISSVSLLKKLKVPFSDIEEHVVHVGNEEAVRLLVASFASESALTNAFLR